MSHILNSAPVARVRAALQQARVETEIVELPGAARTARHAARFLGCDVAQIANSLVFRTQPGDEPLLVMSSGARRVDLDRLGTLVGAIVAKADAEFVKRASGFAIGGVAPVGHPAALRTFVEASLAAHEELWAAAGHPHTVFRLSYADLVRITHGHVVQVALP
jgi:prolyl-tRNA editing enzyme YbaK/EbsC (Cys-tRNA(Pro) deacylase)